MSRALACLVCLVAATALAYSPRSARLLTEEELLAPSGGGPRPIEVTPPSQPVYGAGEIPPEPEAPRRDVRKQEIVEVSPPVAPAAPRRERASRLFLGTVASLVVGGLVPTAVTVGNIGSWGASLAWSVPLSLGIGWLVAPLVTTWAMDGFGVGGRCLVGALLGAAAFSF